MRRFAICGVIGLVVAPIAWSSGALPRHGAEADTESGSVLRASLADTWFSWFPEVQPPPTRDLSGLLMVSNEHRRGPGHRIALDELDGRYSDAQLTRSVVERAANHQQYPVNQHPRGRDYYREKMMIVVERHQQAGTIGE